VQLAAAQRHARPTPRWKQPLKYPHTITQDSLFTMFQILSGDSWASGVTRSLFEPATDERSGNEAAVALYSVSFYLIAGVVFLNVVVAVLLDVSLP